MEHVLPITAVLDTPNMVRQVADSITVEATPSDLNLVFKDKLGNVMLMVQVSPRNSPELVRAIESEHDRLTKGT